MKKNILSICLIMLASLSWAQSPLPKGKAQINAGVGMSSWGVPLYIGFDAGVHPDISLGAEVSYRKYKEYWKWSKNQYIGTESAIWGISGNANYHFNTILKIPSNWDFYAGLNVGFWIWSNNGIYANDPKYNRTSGLGLGGQVGGRYYFNDKFGLNLEFGGGNSFSSGKFGITVKL